MLFVFPFSSYLCVFVTCLCSDVAGAGRLLHLNEREATDEYSSGNGKWLRFSLRYMHAGCWPLLARGWSRWSTPDDSATFCSLAGVTLPLRDFTSDIVSASNDAATFSSPRAQPLLAPVLPLWSLSANVPLCRTSRRSFGCPRVLVKVRIRADPFCKRKANTVQEVLHVIQLKWEKSTISTPVARLIQK